MLNEDAVRGFVESVGADTAKTLILLFTAEARARVARISDLTRRGDWKAVAKEAHGLASASGTYGLTGLAEIVESLGAAADAEDAETAQKLVDEINDKAEGGLDALTNMLREF